MLSRLIFSWLDPFLAIGYSRPLEKDGKLVWLSKIIWDSAELCEDLWRLPDASLAATTTDDIERRFYARCSPEKRPRHLQGDLASNEDTLYVDDEVSVERKSDIIASSSSSAVAAAEDVQPAKASRRGFKRFLSFRKTKNNKPRKPKYDESLYRAIYRVFLTKIWVSGILKLLSGTSHESRVTP